MIEVLFGALAVVLGFLGGAFLVVRELRELRQDLRYFYPEVRRARVFDSALPEDVEALKSEVTIPPEWDVYNDDIEAELRGSPE